MLAITKQELWTLRNGLESLVPEEINDGLGLIKLILDKNVEVKPITPFEEQSGISESELREIANDESGC